MYGMLNAGYIQLPHERAAYLQAEEEHAPGVTCRMNPDTFRVEYIRPDGSIVPGYQHFYRLVLEGET